jgi:hypothetical protein
MRTASGLALVAIGAILAFAVTTSPAFLNLQIAGWVLILTGVAGMLVPRRGYGWLRRRVVRRPRGAVVDPGSRRRPLGMGGRRRRRPRTGPGITLPKSQVPVYERVSDEPAMYERVGDTAPAEDVVVEETVPGAAEPAVETVEEYFQE